MRNENTKDSMGRWNLTSHPWVWQMRCFSSYKQALSGTPCTSIFADFENSRTNSNVFGGILTNETCVKLLSYKRTVLSVVSSKWPSLL